MNRRSFSKGIMGATVSSAFATLASETVPYQLSVMLWTVFTKLPIEERLDKIAESGYRNVELIGEYKKWSETQFQQVLAKSKQLGIHFDVTALLGQGVADPGRREALLSDLRNELPIMERLGCPAVIIMSGNVVNGMSRTEQHASCIEGLKRAAAIVEGKQIHGEPVRLLLENIDPEENPKYYLTSVAEGFEIVRAVGHPQVRLLYDLFHEQISEGNLIEKLEKNIDYTGLIHVADVPGRHIPGTGEINYDNIYRKLVELKYDRIVAMEFLPTGDGVSELRRAKQQALQFRGQNP